MRWIVGSLAAPLEVDALVVPERAERRVDLARQHRRDEVEADVGLLDRVAGSTPAVVEDRLQVGGLVRDARRCRRACRAGPRRRADAVPSDRHQRRQRLLHERADGDELRRPCRARAAARARRRSRGRPCPASSSFSGADGSGGGVISTSRPAVRVLAGRLRGVDAGVVGVGEVVEHERRAARGAAGRAGARAPPSRRRRRARRRAGRAGRREQASGHGPPGSVRGVQSTTRRSSSAQAP